MVSVGNGNKLNGLITLTVTSKSLGARVASLNGQLDFPPTVDGNTASSSGGGSTGGGGSGGAGGGGGGGGGDGGEHVPTTYYVGGTNDSSGNGIYAHAVPPIFSFTQDTVKMPDGTTLQHSNTSTAQGLNAGEYYVAHGGSGSDPTILNYKFPVSGHVPATYTVGGTNDPLAGPGVYVYGAPDSFDHTQDTVLWTDGVTQLVYNASANDGTLPAGNYRLAAPPSPGQVTHLHYTLPSSGGGDGGFTGGTAHPVSEFHYNSGGGQTGDGNYVVMKRNALPTELTNATLVQLRQTNNTKQLLTYYSTLSEMLNHMYAWTDQYNSMWISLPETAAQDFSPWNYVDVDA